jgi:hypothetical protein
VGYVLLASSQVYFTGFAETPNAQYAQYKHGTAHS